VIVREWVDAVSEADNPSILLEQLVESVLRLDEGFGIDRSRVDDHRPTWVIGNITVVGKERVT
jgi:hypothetical protein